jgi:hypothetical protein
MDRQVTCPTCHERQPLPDPDGYTCISCGSAWNLVVCGSCGARFHMRPETRAWTCPSCGVRNEAGEGHVAPAAPPARDPASSTPTHEARRSSGPSSRGRGPMLAILAGVLVLIVVLWAVFIWSPGRSTTASPTHASSPSTMDALADLCATWTADMPIRVDSITRAEDQVREDGKTLANQGNTQAAKAAKDFADALGKLVSALDTHGDTSTAIQKVAEANGALPC